MDQHTAFPRPTPEPSSAQGETYRVEELDVAQEVAYLNKLDADYYTMVGRQKNTEILATLAEKELHGHEFAIGQLKVRTKVTGYVKKHEITGQVLGGENLSLPEEVLETMGMWFIPSPELVAKIQAVGLDLMGGLHAVEHAAIALLPLFAMCDRNDVGGCPLLTPRPDDPRSLFTTRHRRSGFAEKAHAWAEELLAATLEAVASRPVRTAVPIASFTQVFNFNRPLIKKQP